MRETFCAVLFVLISTGLGCAITDYAVITDNDQGRVGEEPNHVVNTNGPAKIKPAVRIATTYSDGTDELFSMVDQKSDGTATITTYNNYSTGTDPIFHDDLYCNPDWNGCAIFTAPDDNDGNLFDGRLNANCSGARSLSILLASSGYYGACGRSRVSVQDRIALLNEGALHHGELSGLLYDLNRRNFGIRLQREGGPIVNVPVFGSLSAIITMEGRGRALVDARNTLLSKTVDAVRHVVAAEGAGAYTLTLDYMGVSVDLPVAFTSAEDIAAYDRLHF